MSDELHDKSRKIETGSGSYQERPTTQKVEVNLSASDTQQLPSFGHARQLQAEIAAIRQRGMTIDDVVRLRRDYEGAEGLVTDALQFETLQSFDVMTQENRQRDKHIRSLFYGLLGAVLISVVISTIIMLATLAARGL